MDLFVNTLKVSTESQEAAAELPPVAKENIIIEIIKKYIWALDSVEAYADDPAAVKQHVSEIISALMDRGECTSRVLSMVMADFEPRGPTTEMAGKSAQHNHSRKHIFCDIMESVMSAASSSGLVGSLIDSHGYNEYVELKDRADKLAKVLFKPVTEAIVAYVGNFMSSYSALFTGSEDFVDKFATHQ